MLAPANYVHQRQLESFPLDNSVVFDTPYIEPVYWEVAQECVPAPAEPQNTGMTFGTFLAIGTSLVSAAVLFDPKASKEAKFFAQTALGVSLPFVLNQAFGLQARPGQMN
jgi:hypothetical protein